MNNLRCNFDRNNLIVNIGDSFSFTIEILQGSKIAEKPYYIGREDYLYVCILEYGQSFENALVKQRLGYDSNKDEKGNVIFTLNPEDTENLKTGEYLFSIKLKQPNNIVTTILPLKEFYIVGTDKSGKECY